MLRYFYILFCIQLCFCTEYIDNSDNENLERRTRSKTSKPHKKLTSTKRSRMVQFDVQNFIQKAEEDGAEADGVYAYRNKNPEKYHRISSSYGDYGSLVESNDNNVQNSKQVDYFNIRGNEEEQNKRSSVTKEANAKHFNFHTMSFEEKDDRKIKDDHEKANSKNVLTNDPLKKCGFRNMKMPFFSHDTTKPRRLKKRKMFCFNCHRTSTSPTNENPFEAKSFDFNKEKTGIADKYISKRAYDYLCPKCIRELLHSFRRKTTKKPKSLTKFYHKQNKATTKEKTTVLPKETLEDKLRDNDYYLSYVRKKRDMNDERERRLKELEEVEKRIDSVHITSPSFKISLDPN